MRRGDDTEREDWTENPLKIERNGKKTDSSAPCAGSGICLVLDTGRGRVCEIGRAHV